MSYADFKEKVVKIANEYVSLDMKSWRQPLSEEERWRYDQLYVDARNLYEEHGVSFFNLRLSLWGRATNV